MGKLIVFNSVSLDGYFTDTNGDMSFAHNIAPDKGWDDFVAGNAIGGGVLMFGRITYELMSSFWQTPFAYEKMPVVAEQMNNLSKIVISSSMENASWKNTKLIRQDLINQIKKLKKETRNDIVILGSGSIVSQLTEANLIDEYQFVLVPIVLGKGRTMFDDLKKNVLMKLKDLKRFNNGNVVLYYEPFNG